MGARQVTCGILTVVSSVGAVIEAITFRGHVKSTMERALELLLLPPSASSSKDDQAAAPPSSSFLPSRINGIGDGTGAMCASAKASSSWALLQQEPPGPSSSSRRRSLSADRYHAASASSSNFMMTMKRTSDSHSKLQRSSSSSVGGERTRRDSSHSGRGLTNVRQHSMFLLSNPNDLILAAASLDSQGGSGASSMAPGAQKKHVA